MRISTLTMGRRKALFHTKTLKILNVCIKYTYL